MRYSLSIHYVQSAIDAGDSKKVGAFVKVTFQWRQQAINKHSNTPWTVSEPREGWRVEGEGAGEGREGCYPDRWSGQPL